MARAAAGAQLCRASRHYGEVKNMRVLTAHQKNDSSSSVLRSKYEIKWWFFLLELSAVCRGDEGSLACRASDLQE